MFDRISLKEILTDKMFQNLDKFDHMIPKLWFEPYSSDSIEEILERDGLEDPSGEDLLPHT